MLFRSAGALQISDSTDHQLNRISSEEFTLPTFSNDPTWYQGMVRLSDRWIFVAITTEDANASVPDNTYIFMYSLTGSLLGGFNSHSPNYNTIGYPKYPVFYNNNLYVFTSNYFNRIVITHDLNISQARYIRYPISLSGNSITVASRTEHTLHSFRNDISGAVLADNLIFVVLGGSILALNAADFSRNTALDTSYTSEDNPPSFPLDGFSNDGTDLVAMNDLTSQDLVRFSR